MFDIPHSSFSPLPSVRPVQLVQSVGFVRPLSISPHPPSKACPERSRMGQIQANRHFFNQHPRWPRRLILIQGLSLRQINVAYSDRKRIITQTDRFALSYLRKQVSSSLPAEWIPATWATKQLIISILAKASPLIPLWRLCKCKWRL